MDIVERTHRLDDLPAEVRVYGRDTVTLGWEERTHGHGRRRTDGGLEFGLALPRGVVLRAGDGLVLAGSRLVVAVVERPERVFVIEPRSAREWALFAYQIGNRHQPLMIADEGLVCPVVPGVELLLGQHDIPFRRATRAFTPVAGAAAHQH